MIWFLEQLDRLDAERRSIQDLEASAAWLSGTRWGLDGSGLYLEAIIMVGSREFPVRMSYPEFYPATPPAVRPQEPSQLWSGHQYVDGALCLEWGPDTWHEGVMGRDMLESAHRLLSVENSGPPEDRQAAPSRHRLTQGQALRGTGGRIYIGPDGLTHLRKLPNGLGSVTYGCHWRREGYLVFIHSIAAAGMPAGHNPGLSREMREQLDARRHVAGIRRVACSASQLAELRSVEIANGLLRDAGLPELDSEEALLVLDANDIPHFFLRIGSEDALYPVALVTSDRRDVVGRLPDEFLALDAKAVGIVGLGSVGSKLAESLARMGVGGFVLVDHDVFLPENARRNALDLHDTGAHKVDAVADMIWRVSPLARVNVARVHLVGQENNALFNGVLRRLGRCDLIIDATADPQVFNLLAAVSRSSQKPLMWAQVLAGGIGGLVARSRPSVDPPASIVRDAYHQFTVDHPAPEVMPVGDYAMVEGGRVLVASDADVGVIASIVAQLAIDSLLGREPSAFPHSLYLVGLARSWVFEAPLHVIPISTEHLRRDEPERIVDEGQVAAGLQFVRSLLPAHDA